MNTKLDLRSLTLGTLIGGVVVFAVGATNGESPVAWEYSVVTEYTISPAHSYYAKDHSTQLNRHAAQGWEVVSSHTMESGDTREIVLKRAKKSK
jgi:hypothetical protein